MPQGIRQVRTTTAPRRARNLSPFTSRDVALLCLLCLIHIAYATEYLPTRGMIPTPTTSHLSAVDFESVYEPAGVCNTVSLTYRKSKLSS